MTQHDGISKEVAADSPTVSVIIPTFNRAKFIVEAVESALQQKHIQPGAEVIVIDDGSDDETSRLLAPYGSRIRYVFQENAGQGAARNHGMQLARGEFVLFLDSDDVLLPGALGGMLARFEGCPGLGAVQGNWRVVNEAGETLSEAEPWHKSPRLDLETWVMSSPLFIGGMLCRRSWVERTGGFNTKLAQVEDVEFVLQMSLLGCEFAWLRRPVVLYRQHAANITRNILEELRSMEQLYETLFRRPELPERIQQRKDEVFYYRYAWSAWRLRQSDCGEEIEDYLSRSLACSGQSPQKTVIHWARLFENWSLEMGSGNGDLVALLPHVRAVIPLTEEQWQGMDRVLPWWIAVWSHYISGGRGQSVSAWVARQQMSTGELLEIAQKSLLMTPVGAMDLAIRRFVQETRSSSPQSALNTTDVASLYLTAFGQAALAHRPRAAVRALWHALCHSGHPRAIGAWMRFVARAFGYATGDEKDAFWVWR
jgi:glycosyltransferase involved in cell wall biosynthesis